VRVRACVIKRAVHTQCWRLEQLYFILVVNLDIIMKSESEETYFALSVIAARNDTKFCISAYTIRYQATVISYLSAEC